ADPRGWRALASRRRMAVRCRAGRCRTSWLSMPGRRWTRLPPARPRNRPIGALRLTRSSTHGRPRRPECARPPAALPRGHDVEARAVAKLSIRLSEHPLEPKAGGRQPVVHLLRPDDGDLGVLRDGPSVGKPVIDLEARPISIERPHPDPIAAARPQPVA